MKLELAVLLPTRGLVFGETLVSLFNNLDSWPAKTYNVFTVSGLPIPDAQNELVKRGLVTMAEYFWFVEEDMVIPELTLYQMMKLKQDIVCVDYPVSSGWSTIKRVDGEIQHCGLGCTLIRRRVFKEIEQPWFRTDKSIDAKTGQELDIPAKYGGHDILFGIKVREAGFTIKQLHGFECGHLRCLDLNRREYNDGTYQIEKLAKISRWQEK